MMGKQKYYIIRLNQRLLVFDRHIFIHDDIGTEDLGSIQYPSDEGVAFAQAQWLSECNVSLEAIESIRADSCGLKLVVVRYLTYQLMRYVYWFHIPRTTRDVMSDFSVERRSLARCGNCRSCVNALAQMRTTLLVSLLI